jgi:hypothetical protein
MPELTPETTAACLPSIRLATLTSPSFAPSTNARSLQQQGAMKHAGHVRRLNIDAAHAGVLQMLNTPADTSCCEFEESLSIQGPSIDS